MGTMDLDDVLGWLDQPKNAKSFMALGRIENGRIINPKEVDLENEPRGETPQLSFDTLPDTGVTGQSLERRRLETLGIL